MISPETGEIRFKDGFVVSKDSSLESFLLHFGKKHFKKSKFSPNCYQLSQKKMGEFYLTFFFFFGSEFLEKVEFEVETEPIERIPWSSNEEVETNWIADQMGDKSNFLWDLRKAGRHYHLEYHWGSIGVYYDFKNGTFTSVLIYN